MYIFTLYVFTFKGRLPWVVPCVCVCVALFYVTNIEELLCTVLGFHRERAKGVHSRSEIANVPTPPVPLWINWGVWILTLHLNYVTGCTGHLLFLFKRTYKYYVDKQGLVPWRLHRVGESKVCLVLLVKVLSDGKISWDPRFKLSWNPSPPTTQSNTCFLKKKRKTPDWEGTPVPEKLSLSHFHYQNNTEFRLIWEYQACGFETGSTDLNSPVTWTRQCTRSRQLQS